MTEQQLSVALKAYAECALWASTDEEGEPLDANYTSEDITLETWDAMSEDMAAFLTTAEEEGLLEGLDMAQVGHDFFLTRNHHGAGFWDRGLGEQGEALTKLAHAYGSQDLYAGDGGFIEL